MRRKPSRTCRGVALVMVALLAFAPALLAATECDSDPNAVFFEATVDPTALNNFLSNRGEITVRPGSGPAVTLPGLCIDHQINIASGTIDLGVGNAPFMVTPSQGSLQVDLTIGGPFQVGFDGRRYTAVNCESICEVDIPYLGTIFSGCELEELVVRPVLSLLQANVSWDDIEITQVADTCVLGDCRAVHPLEFSNTNLTSFDVDLTGFGSCRIEFPPPLDFLGSFDPCDGIDPLIASVLEPFLEDLFGGVFVTRQGAGLLIQVFGFQIIKDGCLPIQEVKDCRAAQNAVAGITRAPRNPALNALLYLLPLGFVGGLSMRVRRRKH